MDPLSILAVLEELRNGCDTIGIHKGVALLLVSYFLKKPAFLSLDARLLPLKILATELHNRRLFLDVKVVNYVLTIYITDDIIAWASKKLVTYLQSPGIFSTLYDEKQYAKAIRFDIVNEKMYQVIVLQRRTEIGMQQYAQLSGGASSRAFGRTGKL